MHSIGGHISSPSFIYRTDKTFKDIRRKKIKSKKVSSFYTTYNFSVEQEIIKPKNFTMDVSVDIRNKLS